MTEVVPGLLGCSRSLHSRSKQGGVCKRSRRFKCEFDVLTSVGLTCPFLNSYIFEGFEGLRVLRVLMVLITSLINFIVLFVIFYSSEKNCPHERFTLNYIIKHIRRNLLRHNCFSHTSLIEKSYGIWLWLIFGYGFRLNGF